MKYLETLRPWIEYVLDFGIQMAIFEGIHKIGVKGKEAYKGFKEKTIIEKPKATKIVESTKEEVPVIEGEEIVLWEEPAKEKVTPEQAAKVIVEAVKEDIKPPETKPKGVLLETMEAIKEKAEQSFSKTVEEVLKKTGEISEKEIS